MTNTSGKTGIQPNNFISGLFNGDLFKKQTFSLSEVLSTSDVDAIKAYNKQIDNCVTSQTAFNRTMLNTSKEAQNVVAAANGNKVALDGLTKSSKAAELGMKALAMAGNMLLIYALTSAVDIIYKCATASDRLAESAAQMGSEFVSTKSDISDYKTKIKELYQTINDDTSSYEDTYNARQELLKIQDEMIDKFGDEADAVKLVTDAINGQTDSLDTLTQDKWQETVNAFNSDRGKGWTEKVADAFANIGHGNNFQRMIDEMEDTEVTFHMIPMYGDDTYEEFSKKLKEDFGADITRTERDDAITLSGDLDTIYKQLLNIQTLAKGMGIDDTFLNDLGNQADEAKSKLDEYQEMYSQHVLYDKIFNSEDYEKSFDEINKAYEKYQDAFASGDEESIEKAKQNYAEIVQSATKGLDDQSVIDYFNSMYPDLQEVVGGWEFEVKFKAAVDDDSDDFEKGVQDAVNKFDTIEDIKNYNPKVATDEQKDAYLQLKQYADEYGLTLDQLIDKLVQLGLLQSQSKSDLLNKLIPSKSSPTAGVASVLTDTMDGVDADEATKWVESLTEEEAKLANSKDFENALEEQKKKLNGASLSADDYAAALQAVKDKQNENSEETPISFTDTLAQVQALSDGLDQLDKIYADVYNKEDFDWSSILNNDGFKEAFGNMTNVTEEYKNAYDDFIETISNNPSDLSACQSAFDNLATAYIYNSDALKNVTEETKASTIAMLSQMGVVNAAEVVNYRLGASESYAADTGKDLESATLSEITAFAKEADMSDITKASLAAYVIEKIHAASITITTSADINNLTALSDYKSLISAENGEFKKLIKEREELRRNLEESVVNGSIKKGSDEWYDMVAKINDVTNAIDESIRSIKQYQNALRQLKWDTFDKSLETVKRVNSEADYYIDLLSHKDMTDKDTGNFTEYGIATIGLHKTNYDNYIAQAEAYQSEYDKIMKQIEKGELSASDENVIQRLRDLQDAHREAKKSAEDELESINDLVKQGYEAQTDALSKLIEKYKKLKDSELEAYRYQKEIAEKTKQIASLQKQLTAYTGNNSEESRATIQKLKVELENAKSDLKDTQYEKFISDTEDMLDDLMSDYQEFIDEKINDTNTILDSIKELLGGNDGIIATLKSLDSSLTNTTKDQIDSSTTNGGDGGQGAKDYVNNTVTNDRKCPECGSTNYNGAYGEDTSIYVSKENLSTSASIESSEDSLKNCFYIVGGDDLMSSAVAIANPSGTNYIINFSDEMYENMPSDLVEKIKAYNANYQECINSRAFNFSSNEVNQYNQIVKYVNEHYPKIDDDGNKVDRYNTISSPIVGYKNIASLCFDCIDIGLILQTSMGKTIEMDNLTIQETMNLLTFTNLSPIAVKSNVSWVATSVVSNTVLGACKALINTALYKVEIVDASYSKDKHVWKGKFKLTSIEDKTITLIGSEVSIAVNNDMEKYLKQNIQRCLNKLDTNYKDLKSLETSDSDFQSELAYYSFDYLSSLKDSFGDVLGIILESEQDELKNKYQTWYSNRVGWLESEMNKRQLQIDAVHRLYNYDNKSGTVYDIQNSLQDELNLETYLGKDMWTKFCAFRMEDMQELGIEPRQFAGFCKDIRYEYTEYNEEDGTPVESSKVPCKDEDGNIIYDYALRYQEFIFLTVHMVQKLWNRVEILEKENAEMRDQIKSMQQDIAELKKIRA